MNYCTNCGAKIDSGALVCSHCGVKIRDVVLNHSSQTANNSVDRGGFGWGVLGFFVPLAGLILYLVWKNEKPRTAKAAGIGALSYLIFYIVMVVIVFIFGFISGVTDVDNNYNDDYYYNFE